MASKEENGAGGPDRPPLPVEIREMDLDDLPAVFGLGDRLFRPDEYPNLYRTWDEYELVESFASDGELCLVADHGDRMVGFVIGRVIRKRRSAWIYGYLTWLGVEPEFEGRGVAARLVDRLTELMIDEGARMMLVDTEVENERALGFFQRCGFTNPSEHVYLTRNLTTLPEYRRRRRRITGTESDDDGGS